MREFMLIREQLIAAAGKTQRDREQSEQQRLETSVDTRAK